MSDLTYGLFVRGQYHAGDDMRKRFEEVKAQVRLADQLGVRHTGPILVPRLNEQ